MKFFPSYNKLNKKTRYSAAAALAAAYFLGFSANVYSPTHIGHYAIPIPVLIPVSHTLPITSPGSSPNAINPAVTSSGNSTFSNKPLVFSHSNITTTFFWVGEPASSDNGYIANSASTWDEQWQAHYGGVDAPSPRNGYNPAGFTPKENPFYFALPYSDLNSKGDRKSSATNCPLVAQKTNYSWCKNSWIAIRHNGKLAYAQWEDAGPFGEDDVNYVFGSALPKNKQDVKAGLDISPALRDYLGLEDVDKTDWDFVSSTQVPSGPWKNIITITSGTAAN